MPDTSALNQPPPRPDANHQGPSTDSGASRTLSAGRALLSAVRSDVVALAHRLRRPRLQVYHASVLGRAVLRICVEFAALAGLGVITAAGAMSWALHDLPPEQPVGGSDTPSLLLEAADGTALGRIGPLKTADAATASDAKAHPAALHVAKQTLRAAVETGIDLLQSNAEILLNLVESTMRLATELTERNVNQYSRLFGGAQERTREATERSSRSNAETMGTLCNTIGEISAEWMRFVQRRAQKNVDRWQTLVSCRTPQDFVAAQSSLMQENLEDFVQGWRRATNKSARASEAVGHKMVDDIETASRAM